MFNLRFFKIKSFFTYYYLTFVIVFYITISIFKNVRFLVQIRQVKICKHDLLRRTKSKYRCAIPRKIKVHIIKCTSISYCSKVYCFEMTCITQIAVVINNWEKYSE